VYLVTYREAFNILFSHELILTWFRTTSGGVLITLLSQILE